MPRRSISYVLICQTYPPVLGGSEIEAQRVSDELQKRGYRPRIVCAGGSPMPPLTEWVDPLGLRVRLHGGKFSGRMRDIAFALGVAWTLFTERRDYEVAYFLMQGLHLATGLPVARLLGKPIVMKFSGSSLVVGMRDSWFGRLELGFLRRWARHILVLNEGMREEAREVGLNERRIGWMPNPVDTDYFQPPSAHRRIALREEFNLEAETPLVVSVGRLDHAKKLPCLLGAFARVHRQCPAARLAMIGDGPLRDEIKGLAARLNIQDAVIFTGRLDSDGVLKWLQAGDAFAMVSEVEGLPCALLEAMSVGLPPVVSRIPGLTQLVEHEVHGLITELGNEESIAQALLRVLSDATLKEKLGAAARRRMVLEFTTASVVDRYETLFKECVESQNPIHPTVPRS